MNHEQRLVRASGMAIALSVLACSSTLGGPPGTGGTTGAAGVGGTAGDAGASGTGDTGTTGWAGTGGTITAAGSGGVTGVGGAGGVPGTGAGGTGETCLSFVPQNCGAALCGNGRRDTCTVHAVLEVCTQLQITETCDGQDFGTDSCVARGYGGGALTCSGDCIVSEASCSDCGADAHVVGCGPAPVDIPSGLGTVGIGASDTEIGVAWQNTRLAFARFSADLTLLGQTNIADPVLDSGPSLYGTIGVGTLPAGWVVAAYAEPELFIHTLDAAGQDLGRTRVDALAANSFSFVSPPVVASRPGGGPLVAWQGASNLRAAIVAADGRSVSTPVDLPLASGTQSLSAAWVGDAFYVAVTTGAAQMRLVRIGADGAAGAAINALPGVRARYVRLVSGAGDLRVLYVDEASANDSAPKVTWQKLAATGAASSDPVVVPGTKKYIAVGGVAFDGDTVGLLDDGMSLDAVRVGPTGAIVTAPVTVAARPFGLKVQPTHQLFARRGTEAVVGWNTDSNIRLARVSP